MGEGYLRRLLAVGATAVLGVARLRSAGTDRIRGDLDRMKPKAAAVAPANNTVRIAWALQALLNEFFGIAFRSTTHAREIADTERPCRCKSRIITSSPSSITDLLPTTIAETFCNPSGESPDQRPTKTPINWVIFKRLKWGVSTRQRHRPHACLHVTERRRSFPPLRLGGHQYIASLDATPANPARWGPSTPSRQRASDRSVTEVEREY